jgi:hypothetical protein
MEATMGLALWQHNGSWLILGDSTVEQKSATGEIRSPRSLLGEMDSHADFTPYGDVTITND